MTRWRSIVKDLAPPALLRALRRGVPDHIRFAGTYPSWATALASSKGYASDAIFEKTRTAALKVARGEAAYERDSVVLDRVEFSYPVIAALLRSACASGGKLSVLDFGGALGTSYRQFKAYQATLRELQWNIVEQPRYVQFGREHFANEELRFFDSVAAATAHSQPNAILLSGVLQYLEEPYQLIHEIAASTTGSVIIDRTYCTMSTEDALSVQIVPTIIYDASYPCWLFSRSRLLRSFEEKYKLADSFVDTTHTWTGPNGEFSLAGFVLDRRA